MDQFLTAFLTGESLLLSFLLCLHPLGQNSAANKWLSLSFFVVGAAFAGNYITDSGASLPVTSKVIGDLQFLLAPSLYVSVLLFVAPSPKFKRSYGIHFLPFLVFAIIDVAFFNAPDSLSTTTLFTFGGNAFWVRDLLPFQLAAYLVASYRAFRKHDDNLRLVTASVGRVDLRWLRYFLLVFIVPVLLWINDALSLLPSLVGLNRPIYAAAIFFVGQFALRQTAIFPFDERELGEIETMIESPPAQSSKTRRLSTEQTAELASKLEELMTAERLFLDNEITLPMLAAKLGVGVHDASYVINEATGGNFYSYINNFRVEEAKKLLVSSKADRLNILGIAFESGFNSKTAFNTAFRKATGISPSEYAKSNR